MQWNNWFKYLHTVHPASRLPKAYTCFNQLNLCINYDLKIESEIFISDLKNAFSQCFTGFNEDALHDNYSKTFDKPKDLELVENQESRMYRNSLIILLGFIFLLFSYVVFKIQNR